MCGLPSVKHDVSTYERPRNERDWGKVCSQCRIQYDLNREEERKKQLELWENTPPPTFRERVESFARFGSGGGDHYYLVPLLLVHVCTLGLSTAALASGQKVAQWYLKVTK